MANVGVRNLGRDRKNMFFTEASARGDYSTPPRPNPTSPPALTQLPPAPIQHPLTTFTQHPKLPYTTPACAPLPPSYPHPLPRPEVAAIDRPQLHLWETGVIRITRHPQMVGQVVDGTN